MGIPFSSGTDFDKNTLDLAYSALHDALVLTSDGYYNSSSQHAKTPGA